MHMRTQVRLARSVMMRPAGQPCNMSNRMMRVVVIHASSAIKCNPLTLRHL